MPAGADTVMIQENATLHQGEAGAPDQVTFSRAAIPHENVRRAGTDAMAGAHILPTGRVLSPGDISLFASLGLRQVQVFRRPVVGILSTGDELVDIDGPPLRPGQIRNSNAYALAAAVREAGGVPVVHPVVRDSYEEVRQAFSSATGADVLVSCGGMSVGDHDHVKSVIRELSGDTFGFWKVAVKPGKPVGFGHIDGCAVFGLPGNPVSALVTFELFVKPALLRLQGHTRCVPVARRAYARSEVPAGGKRTIYLRASASYDGDSGLWADVSRSQSSGAVTSMANADALVVVPPGAPVVAAGGVVRIIPLSTSIDRE